MAEYGRIHTDGSRSGGQPLHSDVEQVARALAQADGIEICSDATYALSSYGHKAKAALAAMRQPAKTEAMEYVIHSSMPIDFERRYAMDNLIAHDADLIDVTSEVTEADREVLIRISNSDDETAQRIRRGLIYTWEVGEISRHRLAERAAIVAWLMREEDDYPSGKYSGFAAMIREEIEAGEHLK